MSLQVSVPRGYGGVLLVAVASSAVNWWHGERTMTYRRLAGVELPNAYASATEVSMATDEFKYLFNCAQRAHANYAENQGSFIAPLLISGLKYPTWSAALGVLWLVGRVTYAIGYTRTGSKKGEGKDIGLWWIVPHLALMGTASFVAWGFTG